MTQKSKLLLYSNHTWVIGFGQVGDELLLQLGFDVRHLWIICQILELTGIVRDDIEFFEGSAAKCLIIEMLRLGMTATCHDCIVGDTIVIHCFSEAWPAVGFKIANVEMIFSADRTHGIQRFVRLSAGDDKVTVRINASLLVRLQDVTKTVAGHRFGRLDTCSCEDGWRDIRMIDKVADDASTLDAFGPTDG